ncbi:MAG TPA: alpha/beta fold hydrolase [Eoetvoesiella sp.]
MSIKEKIVQSQAAGVSRRAFFKTTAIAGAGLASGGVLAGIGADVAVAASPTPAVNGPAPVWTPVAMPKQVPVKEGVAELPGTKLWYWDTGGDGEVVIFMHAGSQSAAGWGYQQPVFAKAGCRVIGYSRRGYYKSDLGDKANPGIAAEDLHDLINYLKLDKVHLVAIAHGGYFALDYVLTHPEKVKSISIISSMMGVQDSDYKAINAHIRPKFFTDLPLDFKELGPSYRTGDPEGQAAWNKLAAEARPGGRVMPKFNNEITWAKLESIKTPTLLMTGDADLYTPPALLRLQASHMPHAEVVIVEEAAHCANWEQPEVFNKTVLAFVGKHK